jgi:transcriptional regulator with XRE-family HTH domain
MAPALGTFIRHRRQHLGLTQQQLSVRVGLGTEQAYISRLEQGQVTLPRWARLRALAAALEVSPGDLLLRTGLLTSADVQDSAEAPVKPTLAKETPARAEIHAPIGVFREWETAAIFTCP